MEEFLNTSFTEPSNFLLLTAIIFLVTFIRYLVFSGAYHYLFYRLLSPWYNHRILNPNPKQWEQLFREIRRSALTSAIFAISGTLLVIGWQQGWVRLYWDWDAWPLWWMPLSMALVLLAQETYYYWLHRWMHQPRVYRKVHKWHHDSIETTSLTSFSFHPIESVLQAALLPLLLLVIPMHLLVFFALLMLMTLSGIINHSGVEVYPGGRLGRWMGKWVIGATHHDLHHKQFRYNFGLYFTFWDRWMHTESPDFDAEFPLRQRKL